MRTARLATERERKKEKTGLGEAERISMDRIKRMSMSVANAPHRGGNQKGKPANDVRRIKEGEEKRSAKTEKREKGKRYVVKVALLRLIMGEEKKQEQHNKSPSTEGLENPQTSRTPNPRGGEKNGCGGPSLRRTMKWHREILA